MESSYDLCTYRYHGMAPNLAAKHASAEICGQMTGFYNRRKLGQIHQPGPDGSLVVVDAEHLDGILAGIAGEILDALQRVDILEDLYKVLWEQVGSLLEPRC